MPSLGIAFRNVEFKSTPGDLRKAFRLVWIIDLVRLSPPVALQLMMMILLSPRVLLVNRMPTPPRSLIATLPAMHLTQENRTIVFRGIERAQPLLTLATTLPAAFPLIMPVLVTGFKPLSIALETAIRPRRRRIARVETTTRPPWTMNAYLSLPRTSVSALPKDPPPIEVPIRPPRPTIDLLQLIDTFARPLTLEKVLPTATPRDGSATDRSSVIARRIKKKRKNTNEMWNKSTSPPRRAPRPNLTPPQNQTPKQTSRTTPTSLDNQPERTAPSDPKLGRLDRCYSFGLPPYTSTLLPPAHAYPASPHPAA